MRRPLLISAGCILATVVLLFWGFGRTADTRPATPATYALIIGEDTGTFVMQLRKGLQQAASENGAQLTILTEDAFQPKKDWAAAVLWLDNPASALETLRNAGVPCVVVDQAMADMPYVVSDDESAGRQMIEYALALDPDADVALLRDNTDGHATARGRAAIQWGKTGRVRTLDYAPGMDIPDDIRVVVTVSLRATLDLAARIRAGAWSGRLVGIDTGENRVADLEDGVVSAMALDSPFAMGYEAFDLARRAAQGTGRDAFARSRVQLITPENMYLAENVKQVFPLLQ